MRLYFWVVFSAAGLCKMDQSMLADAVAQNVAISTSVDFRRTNNTTFADIAVTCELRGSARPHTICKIFALKNSYRDVTEGAKPEYESALKWIEFPKSVAQARRKCDATLSRRVDSEGESLDNAHLATVRCELSFPLCDKFPEEWKSWPCDRGSGLIPLEDEAEFAMRREALETGLTSNNTGGGGGGGQPKRKFTGKWNGVYNESACQTQQQRPTTKGGCSWYVNAEYNWDVPIGLTRTRVIERAEALEKNTRDEKRGPISFKVQQFRNRHVCSARVSSGEGPGQPSYQGAWKCAVPPKLTGGGVLIAHEMHLHFKVAETQSTLARSLIIIIVSAIVLVGLLVLIVAKVVQCVLQKRREKVRPLNGSTGSGRERSKNNALDLRESRDYGAKEDAIFIGSR